MVTTSLQGFLPQCANPLSTTLRAHVSSPLSQFLKPLQSKQDVTYRILVLNCTMATCHCSWEILAGWVGVSCSSTEAFTSGVPTLRFPDSGGGTLAYMLTISLPVGDPLP